jgi:hypothetical protein
MNITRKRTEETNWDCIRALVRSGGLNVGDEIADELLTGEKITYVVANISPEEVYFISKDCLDQRVQWNESGLNAGGFKDSDVCKFLNETVWNMLPEELREVISERECLQIVDGEESRFSLKLWLPSEYEVFEDDWASEAKEGQQFEIFKDPRNRIKGAGDRGSRAYWWLLSVCGGYSTLACFVNHGGNAYNGNCSTALRVPVCFSIKIKE